MTRPVTLVIHGTFASQEQWWRLGSEGHATFADRLERALSHHGLPGTVWKRALNEGFSYSSFSWSGRNRHRDRVVGAGRLSSSVNQLAQKVRATPSDPLTVNFVAHSHGGNVVLEALRHLKPNVRVGRIALLGTPLVTVKPAFRIARLVFSAILLGVLFLGLLIFVTALGSLLFTLFGGEISEELEKITGVRGMAILLAALVFYGWMFWAFGNLLDVTWRVVCRLFEPLAWMRGKSRSLVYGPSPRKLAASLGGQPILLLTTPNDEADLLLQVGSTPARLYREYVGTRSSLQRLFEYALLRPFVLCVFLKVVEVLLERLSLGFSVWRILVQDFEVASNADRPYYPAHLLVQETPDVHPETGVASARVRDNGEQDHRAESTVVPPLGLRLSLHEVADELKRQIQLRHSSYYENQAVIHRIAEFLTDGEVEVVGESRPSSSRKPSDAFWETLLAGNVGLAGLYTWIADPSLLHPMFIFTTMLAIAYGFPFALLGIMLVFDAAIRRRLPTRLWRSFWVVWAVVWLIYAGIALSARLDTPPGVTVRHLEIDGELWRQVPTVALSGPDANVYWIFHQSDSTMGVLFGDGQHGRRPPSGPSTIRMRYRVVPQKLWRRITVVDTTWASKSEVGAIMFLTRVVRGENEISVLVDHEVP